MDNMPRDLVLVRHGRSEGNLAQAWSKAGEIEKANNFFKSRHTSLYRLTNEGRQQADVAGKWIKENFSAFDLAYTSDYIRARETAGHLNLDQKWHITFNLREREAGNYRSLTDHDKLEADAAKTANPFYWRPAGGESVADICSHVDRVLGTIRNHYQGKQVIIVCHAEIIRAFRVRIEHILPEDYSRFNYENPYNKIYNGSIVHYTRQNPQNQDIDDHARWVRMVCPWDQKLSSKGFNEITRPIFSTQELIKEVEAIPQILNEENSDIELDSP